VNSDDDRFSQWLDDLSEIEEAQAKVRDMERAADRRYRGAPVIAPAEKPKAMSRKELLDSGLQYYKTLRGEK